ncbi:MAG: hypothetical protein Q9166_000888 [cf. Caloplaca sp. 2 TL-2023]
MPTYHTGCINVRLSVADYNKTTTPNPVTHQGRDSIANAEKALKQFEDDSTKGTLTETSLSSDADGYSLGFLGDCRNMPFLMVHAKPQYPFTKPPGKPPGSGSAEKKRPPPLQLVPSVPAGDSQDSPLTELSSPPLSPPFHRRDDTGIRATLAINNNEESKLPRQVLRHHHSVGARGSEARPSINQLSVTNSPIISTSFPMERRFGSPSYQLYEDVQGQHQVRPLEPQALCLRILPTKKDFLYKGGPRMVKWGHNDMKADIFLNGELCSSAFIPETAFYKKDPLRDTFSGVRVGFLTEKPWILAPAVSAFSGIANDANGGRPMPEDAECRWNEIAGALKLAAESLGRNERNAMSPISEYLQSLADLPMPATLPDMLEFGSKRFAVIDVVVITGKGRKEEASAPYLMRPLPLKLPGYGAHRDSTPVKALPDIDTPPPRKRHRTARPTRSAADAEILSQQFSLEYVRRGSAGRFTRAIDNDDVEAGTARYPHGHHSKGKLTVPGHSMVEASPTTPNPAAMQGSPSKQPTRLHNTPIPLALQPKQVERNRMKYQSVTNTRQTREEELKDIVDQAANNDGFVTKRFVTRSKLTGPTATTDIVVDTSVTQTPAGADTNTSKFQSPTKIVTLKYSPSKQHSFSQPPAIAANDDSQAYQTPTTATYSLRSHARRLSTSLPLLPIPLPTATGITAFDTSNAMASPERRRDTSPSPTLPVESMALSSPEQPLILRHKPATVNPNHTPNTLLGAIPPLDTPISRRSQPATSPTHLAGPIQPLQRPHTSNSPLKRKKPRKSSITYQKRIPFEIPELSKGSIVTFAEEGTVRQVRSERGGWFREEEVLVGVRFVVG